MNKIWLVVTGVLLLSTYGCGDDDDQNTSSIDTQIQTYLNGLGIAATRDDSGVYFYSEVSNTGGATVTSEDVVAIFYNLYDLEDNLLAAHQRPADSLIYQHNASAIYPIGLDQGIGSMRVGETYSFILPPDQGYSQITDGSFSPTGIYRLQVELVGVFDENALFAQELLAIDDYVAANNLNDTISNPLNRVEVFGNGVSYKRVVEGTGDLPGAGDSIVVAYQGTFLDGSGFDSQTDFAWIWGSNQPRALVDGFEFGVSLMQEDENALVFIPSSEAYRESALIIPGSATGNLIENEVIPEYVSTIPPYQTLIFDITRTD